MLGACEIDTPLKLYSLSKNRAIEFGAVAVAIAPLAAAYVLSRQKQTAA